MILHFVGGKTSNDLSIIKETKKYIIFRCHSNTMKYRYNKETREVQDGTYHNVIKGMSLELQEVQTMMILGESYDEYFGLDEYDPYDPCEGYDEEWDNEELEAIEELNEIFNLQEVET